MDAFSAEHEKIMLEKDKVCNQWRNVVGLANMAPHGGKKAPLSGAPDTRAYWEQFVKILQKNLNT